MNLSLDVHAHLITTSSGISLSAVEPILNGAVITTAPPGIRHDADDAFSLRFNLTAPPCVFSISFRRETETSLAIQYWVEGLPDDFILDSFGIRFTGLAGARAILRNGYFSWDGSEYVELAAPCRVMGYGMAQLLPSQGTGSMVIGFERHAQFQQTFTLTCHETALLVIETLWDRKPRPNSICESEPLVVFEHAEVEEGLREWARRVASTAPAAPRMGARITGWCSWYNLYASITEENILEHLRGVAAAVRRNDLQMRVFQIDDGFTPEMGDWLDVKPQFPRGMKPVLDDIRNAGFIPGLWIAPFMVGNRSRLFRQHPDWVVRERATGEPLAQMKFHGEFRWHKRSEEYYILDTTHPDALGYLRRVFRVWRREWGCEYFKTDFMQFGSEHGPERARYHTPGMTRIEIWRRTAEMIREEIGDALWLGCGCPLWASVGLVDAVRIGRDVGVSWSGERSAASLLRDTANRSFANGILWQADPDCILLRERFHLLSDEEIRSLALFGGLLGGVLMTSDTLEELPAERLHLWKFLLDAQIISCRFPFVGNVQGPLIAQLCKGETIHALFLLNPSDTELDINQAWSEFGVQPPQSVFDWVENQGAPVISERLSCSLAPHQSKLLLLG